MADFSGPAYVAMKSKDTTLSWLDTGIKDHGFSALLPYQGTAGRTGDQFGPPQPTPEQDTRTKTGGTVVPGKFYYAPVRAIHGKVLRDFGGINSSGGPQITGRCEHEDFTVEQGSNKSSSILFQHCCAGEQLEWVHLALLQKGRKWPAEKDANGDVTKKEYLEPDRVVLHIRLKDVSLTSFDFKGVRYFGEEFTGSDPKLRKPKLVGTGHIDTFTLLYTSISFEYEGVARGWDTGTNDKI